MRCLSRTIKDIALEKNADMLRKILDKKKIIK